MHNAKLLRTESQPNIKMKRSAMPSIAGGFTTSPQQKVTENK